MVKRPDLIKRNKERALKKIKLKCPCGKVFYVLPKRKNIAKYCSQKCYHKYTSHARAKGKRWNLSEGTKKKHSLCQIGEKNHNWKGGITEPRHNQKIKKWTRAVKKIYKFCAICGENKNLEAHHLESFDKNKKLRFNINNGISLCKKHHKEFHKKYGYGKNTKNQFEEFITEKCIKITKTNVKNIKIYNLTLEGEDTFFANGILNHNTSPHYTSANNLKAWARRVLQNENAAFAIRNKIARFGTEAQPFLRPALDQVKNIWVKRYMDEILSINNKV